MISKILKVMLVVVCLIIVSIVWLTIFIQLGQIFYIVAILWLGFCIFAGLIVLSELDFSKKPATIRQSKEITSSYTNNIAKPTQIIIQQNNFFILDKNFFPKYASEDIPFVIEGSIEPKKELTYPK